MPITAGMAGPANLRTLMRYAINCGIGPSTRVLVRKARGLARMMTVSAPDELITALAAAPGRGINRVHFFPFGGFERTANWLKAVCNGDFTMNGDGKGFRVNADPP